jgi:hypothetical protein
MKERPSYEIVGKVWESQFPGHCTVEYEHKIRRGDQVARVRRADNPMLPVGGVACTTCIKLLPRAKN